MKKLRSGGINYVFIFQTIFHIALLLWGSQSMCPSLDAGLYEPPGREGIICDDYFYVMFDESLGRALTKVTQVKPLSWYPTLDRAVDKSLQALLLETAYRV